MVKFKRLFVVQLKLNCLLQVISDKNFKFAFLFKILKKKMEQKMKSTVILLKNEQQISFFKVISYTKFGYNALFQYNSTQGSKQSYSQSKYFDVYAFSKSLLQINNLKNHIEQIIKLYSKLNNSKILCPIVQKIEEKDMLYIVSQVQKYSLRQLIEKRQGLTQYEVTYFIMELFQILNYCKSRQIYFEKLELSNLYLNEDMKLSLPFNMFLNKATNKPLLKRLPFRNQARNRNNCPQLFWNLSSDRANQRQKIQSKTSSSNSQEKQQNFVNINLVDSWNMGTLVYQLFQNCKPFQTNCSTPIIAHSTSHHSNSVTKQQLYQQQEIKQYYKLNFYQTQSYQARQLISKLLQVDLKKRLNFPLILIEPIFKKIQQIPHILPSTILTCPPSQEFKQSYRQNFPKQKLLQLNAGGNGSSQTQKINHRSLKKRNEIIKTQIIQKSSNINMASSIIPYNKVSGNNIQNQRRESLIDGIPNIDPQLFTPVHQTQKYIKAEERSLTENKIYIQQFVDISHVYGYGYQMNTGTLCFVFNDQTQFFFPNSNRKYLVYVNQKKGQTSYSYDKLPQEQDLKKKIFILEAYSKSIKKFKTPTQSTGNSPNQKIITVLRYGKTKHASIFYISNDSVQVFFNDKICFLMTKTNIYVLGKNNDKYEKYDYRNQSNQMKTRRQYVIAMAKKIFGWKKDKILQDSQIQQSKNHQKNQPQKNPKRRLGKRKNSILAQLDQQNILGNKQSRLQSLKKIKEKQQRTYHLMKKSVSPADNQQNGLGQEKQ